MKKGDLFEGKVARTEFPCKGIIYIDIEQNGEVEKKKVMVKDALEGQEVRLSISKKKKDRLEGRLLEVLKPSEAERESPCPHFGLCGGCRYQTLPYEQQLNLKKRQVEKLIENSGLDFPIEKIYGRMNCLDLTDLSKLPVTLSSLVKRYILR